MSDPCPFCSPPADRLFFSGELAFGLWDGFPVSRGHALVIPRRHFASWFDATPQEHQALVEGVAAAREEIGKQFSPDGYNVGINVGAAAGQTVFHLHVHVIPRYAGDVPNPRGGVRHIIPHKADYRVVPATVLEQVSRVPHQRPLVRGEDDPLLPHLVADVDRACAADIAVAFVRSSGVVLVWCLANSYTFVARSLACGEA